MIKKVGSTEASSSNPSPISPQGALESQASLQKWFRKWRNRIFLTLKHQLILIRTTAALLIQKTVRGWLVRKFFLSIRFKKLITWEHEGSRISLRGSFTDPPWSEPIELRYYKYLKLYGTTVISDRHVPDGIYSVKFIVDGVWKCNGNLPLSVDDKGNYNNALIVQSATSGFHRSMRLRSISHDILPGMEIVRSDCNSPLILAHSLSNSASININNLYSQTPTGRIKLLMGSFIMGKNKHKERLNNECADAFFIDNELQAFAVADGVGEWGGYGLNPSDFSKELIENLHVSMNSLKDHENFLEQSLYSAYYSVKSYGSSTILAGICQNSMLSTISLGDSSFLVLRRREFGDSLITVYRSSEQQHSFNCPFQLTHLPAPSDYDELAMKGFIRLISLLRQRKKTCDTLLDAVEEMIPLRKGDLVIVGTDGLYDNLFDQDIMEISEKYHRICNGEELAQKLAKELGEEALRKSRDSSYKSPFARNAAKAGRKFIGGKIDDITVLVLVAEEI